MMIYLGKVRCTLFLGLLGPLMTFFCFTLLTTRKKILVYTLLQFDTYPHALSTWTLMLLMNAASEI